MKPEMQFTTETQRHKDKTPAERAIDQLQVTTVRRAFDNKPFSLCLCVSVVNEVAF